MKDTQICEEDLRKFIIRLERFKYEIWEYAETLDVYATQVTNYARDIKTQIEKNNVDYLE